MLRAAVALCVLSLLNLAARAQVDPGARAPELPAVSFDGLRNSAQGALERAAIPDPVSAAPDKVPVSPGDAAAPAGLPSVGKWMLDKNGDVAHWLGRRANGLLLDEPVNVLIRVRAAAPAAAIQKVAAAAKAAGFTPRDGHSNGYASLLDGKKLEQENKTFSDRPFFESNDHFRLFGPVRFGDYYYFSAAISREKVALIVGEKADEFPPTHEYVSFNKTRDAFAAKMKSAGGAGIVGLIPLGSAIPNDGFQTTGDHDGAAVLLELPRPSLKRARTARKL
jgi:hypothetical protein